MNNSVYRVTLDVYDHSSQATLNVMQGDNARAVRFTLTEDGKPYLITEGCTAVFRAVAPDGTVFYNSCQIVEDSVIVHRLTAGTTAVPGEMPCELTLYGTNNTKITSPRFTMIVHETLYSDDEVEAEDEFTALTQAISDVNTLDVDVSKEGTVATVTVTKKDGTTETVEINDGERGPKGDVYTENAYLNSYGHLIIVLTDGTSIDAGQIDGVLTDHRELNYRDAAGSHPMSAITGLEDALDTLGEVATNAKAGLIKGSNGYGMTFASDGTPRAGVRTAEAFKTAENEVFVSVGTLKNVLSALVHPHGVYYGVCSGSGTNRTVTVDDSFTLVAGAVVLVKFSSTFNTGITLNVNGTGAKTVKNADGSSIGLLVIRPNQCVRLLYDGTDWIFENASASTSYPGQVRLDNTYTSASVAMAPTSNALKSSHDLLKGGINSAIQFVDFDLDVELDPGGFTTLTEVAALTANDVPIGIVQQRFTGSGYSWLSVYQFYVDGSGNLQISLRNLSTSAAVSAVGHFKVAYHRKLS